MKPRFVLAGLVVLAWASIVVAARHPLDALEASEYEATVGILVDSGRVSSESLYQLITIREPSKDWVRAWRPGDQVPRSAFAVIKEGSRTFEAVVDLDARSVRDWREIEGVQPGFLFGELFLAADLTKADPRWQEAMRKRGITDFEQVFCLPLSTGYYNVPDEEGRRLMKVPCNDLRGSKTNIHGKPIAGVHAIVDLNAREVLDVIDTGETTIPNDSANYDPDSLGTLRKALEPVHQVSPNGNNFVVDGRVVRWQNWSFHFRMDKRAGLVVSLAGFQDRPVMYQGYLSELFVPYMDPSVHMYWRTFMDVGEYGLGLMATALAHGSDCSANAVYFPAVLPLLGDGKPATVDDAICLFERNDGSPAWRHAESLNETHESRPKVELVLRMASAVGNYDYFLDWVFTQAGEIRVEIGATGIDLAKSVASTSMADATAAEDTRYGTLVAPNIVAPFHDHFFNFRLDLDIDGTANRFVKDTVVTKKLDSDHPRTSIWAVDSKTVKQESDAKLRINLERPAQWRIISADKTNAVGNPTGYVLQPAANILSLMLSDDFPQKRGAFTNYHLWVTPHDETQKFASGDYVNMSKGDDGLAVWSRADRSIDNTDLVVWYTLGMRHITAAEDWPVLPTKWLSFTLKPFNFFDRSPVIDLHSP
jgi:primary-amine oxidase